MQKQRVKEAYKSLLLAQVVQRIYQVW